MSCRRPCLLLLLGSLLLLGGASRGAGEPTAPTNTPAALEQKLAVYEDMAVLTEAVALVRRHYVEEVSHQKIVYGAIHGMLAGLDPHSDFLEPQQVSGLKEETEGHFSGIGIHIGLQGGYPQVVAPIEDSPADRAGLLAGDLIVAVDGRSTQGFTLDLAMKALRGAAGSTVMLTIAREGRDPFDVRLARGEVQVASVRGTRVLRGNIGYLRITQFSEPTGPAFAAALERLVVSNRVEGLVLDLRDNPGGLLNQAVDVAQLLLPAKALVVTTRGRDGVRPQETYEAGGRTRHTEIPLAVLINRGSASASEIVAGALQDHRRAIVIGERSFGKASVQNILKLSTRPACGIKLTTAHYYTPRGRLIHGRGIEPDLAVPQPPSAWQKARLKRAYEEQPEAFPAARREALDGVVDAPLERALDVLVGVRVLARE